MEREAEAREAAELTMSRFSREVVEIRNKLDEEIILRANAERFVVLLTIIYATNHLQDVQENQSRLRRHKRET